VIVSRDDLLDDFLTYHSDVRSDAKPPEPAQDAQRVHPNVNTRRAQDTIHSQMACGVVKYCHGCGAVEDDGEQRVGDVAPRTMRRCGGCRVALYCSSECQKAHWKVHRSRCHRDDDKRALLKAVLAWAAVAENAGMLTAFFFDAPTATKPMLLFRLSGGGLGGGQGCAAASVPEEAAFLEARTSDPRVAVDLANAHAFADRNVDADAAIGGSLHAVIAFEAPGHGVAFVTVPRLHRSLLRPLSRLHRDAPGPRLRRNRLHKGRCVPLPSGADADSDGGDQGLLDEMVASLSRIDLCQRLAM
jgi:hypothetical protein